MSFIMRLKKPEKGNKYYIRKASGGYSNAIKGRPVDSDCDVLSNCVGYAYGRFNEIANLGYCKYLAPVNAENFMQYKGTCKSGSTPKLGSCMVWQKGASLSGSDGAGHVAIVEKVISDTEVITSESGYGCSTPFWTRVRKKGADGRWGANSSYKFLGFIYNPSVNENDEGIVNSAVKTIKIIKAGSVVSISKNAIYYTGKGIPYWVKARKWIVSSIVGQRAVINKSTDGKFAINSPINTKYLIPE